MEVNQQSAKALYGSSTAIIARHPETGDPLMVLRVSLDCSPELPNRTKLVIMDLMESFMDSADAVVGSILHKV